MQRRLPAMLAANERGCHVSRHRRSGDSIDDQALKGGASEAPRTAGLARLQSTRLLTTAPEKFSRQPSNLTKVASIIEDRPLATLVPLILTFSFALGPDWPIRVFHGSRNVALLKTSPPIQRLIESGGISLHLLPAGIDRSTSGSISAFLTAPWYWKQLAPAQHVLMVQVDTVLCPTSARSVDDFLAYDLIGAPVSDADGLYYNGDLSLRNREKTLEVIRRFGSPSIGESEEQWFVRRLKELPSTVNGNISINLPTFDVASRFAGQPIGREVGQEQPWGMIHISTWLRHHSEKIGKRCPEFNMATARALHPAYRDVDTHRTSLQNIGKPQQIVVDR
ncbi:MAG: hypothetical protein Q9186_006893 [Xanthomendoza sp. 1 TL-2023]